ncbi:aminotransferase class I/II-fold pyridoxal phosphate-dependent enzyme [Roseomonas marmotae]|uniref:Aminotransferase class I/II-fold pyridoxal phosphate-dependent enzyme n=1 Tax=Roseomonas marmotae TaxID=2768161 RepID=A0ABS3K6H3_9PROT|nr:aminotransferase class I/II-fold pyridoxal phosphate-dependent enzyme [Roseomonas marmotae]MBO1073054.1 aminotransferase class I/II-fold pyridoxal phosphate-dependent enzyme [Roseomonas marmotae]QTI79301.1 aminotransferase class I/II-fold pyridoxal phosphate-dependent enzyme [Roseomonas marmotae]
MSGGLSATARLALLARLSKRRSAEESAPRPDAGSARDFSTLPGMRDYGLLRTALASLNLPSPLFQRHEGLAGAHSRVDGRDVVNFASYNYLGLNGDPRVQAAAKAAIDRYGVSVSGARITAGERDLHHELEAALAEWHGAEAALTFVSGHATNVTTIGHLMGPRDVVVHDAAIHNSCTEGVRLSGARRVPFAHNDMAAAEKEMARARRGASRAMLLLEGHYSMDGDCPDLATAVEMARRHDAWLMVDEAHSLGVLGATGHGVAEAQGVDPAGVDLWMGTLSKTLSASGGYIAARRDVIDWLRHTAPGSVYSVGLAPPLAAAALESLRILKAEPERVARLQANGRRLRDLFRERGFDTGGSIGAAIVPVIIGSSIRAARLSHAMLDRGVAPQIVTFPAVPEQSARLRFFVCADHTEADLLHAAEMLAEASASLGAVESLPGFR